MALRRGGRHDALVPVRALLTAGDQLGPETETGQGTVYTIAGRIMFLRKMGKASFLQIQDESGRLQVYVKRDVVGDDSYTIFKKMDIGDIAGFSGTRNNFV